MVAKAGFDLKTIFLDEKPTDAGNTECNNWAQRIKEHIDAPV